MRVGRYVECRFGGRELKDSPLSIVAADSKRGGFLFSDDLNELARPEGTPYVSRESHTHVPAPSIYSSEGSCVPCLSALCVLSCG